jgi:hypothetical protein
MQENIENIRRKKSDKLTFLNKCEAKGNSHKKRTSKSFREKKLSHAFDTAHRY